MYSIHQHCYIFRWCELADSVAQVENMCSTGGGFVGMRLAEAI